MINLEKVIKKRRASSLRSLTGNRSTENHNRQVKQQMAKYTCINPQTNTKSVPVLGCLSIKMQQVVLQISEPPCIQTLIRETAAYQLWAEWNWRLGVNAESGRMGYTQCEREEGTGEWGGLRMSVITRAAGGVAHADLTFRNWKHKHKTEEETKKEQYGWGRGDGKR